MRVDDGFECCVFAKDGNPGLAFGFVGKPVGRQSVVADFDQSSLGFALIRALKTPVPCILSIVLFVR